MTTKQFALALALTLSYLHTAAAPSEVDAPFHPQCLENFYSLLGNEPQKFVDCDREKHTSAVKVELNEKRHITASSSIEYGGYISYTISDIFYPRQGEETYLLSSSMNTGGTGNFGSLFLVGKNLNTSRLELILSISGGDRCNDGYISSPYLDGSSIYWSSAATPFRLLNPFEMRNERMVHITNVLFGSSEEDDYQYLSNWKPYDDVANSASSCAGSLEHEFNILTGEQRIVGIELSLGEGWGSWANQNQGSMHECLSQWRPVDIEAGVESAFFTITEWKSQLDDIATKCSKKSHLH